jgi:hypothetical protein
MPGLEPGIHQTKKLPVRWIAGSFGPKTRFAAMTTKNTTPTNPKS